MQGVEILAARDDRVLTDEALAFVAGLHRDFNPERERLLAARGERMARLRAGELPDFLPETASVRDARLARRRAPADLQDRRVEITGPVDRKMVINALNSGASVFMADFEDANSPTWANCVEGQAQPDRRRRADDLARDAGEQELLAERRDRDAARAAARLAPAREARRSSTARRSRAACSTSASTSSTTRERARRARHAGRTSTCRSSRATSRRGSGTTSSSPRRSALGIPRGTIRATVLIETILAAFEMDEILYELREHSAGLNAGRWDYIFSVIKKFRDRPEFVLPDRGAGDDDGAVHARVHASCSSRPATGAARTRSAAWPRSSRRGATPEVNARRARRRCARTRSARRATASTAPGSRTRTSSRRRTAEFDRVLGDRPNQIDRQRDGRVGDRRATCSTSPRRPGDVTEDGRALERLASGSSTSTPGCAAPARRRSTT